MAGVDRHQRMPVVRSNNPYRVDILPVKLVFIKLIGITLFVTCTSTSAICDQFQEKDNLHSVHIATYRNLNIRISHESAKIT